MRREGGSQHGDTHSGRGSSQAVPPTPLGCGAQHCVNSVSRLEPGASATQVRPTFSTGEGSSVVTGSNQRRDAFSPRRRDPRCRKTQLHGQNRFCCSLLRTSVGSPVLLLIAQEVYPCSFAFGLRCFSFLFPSLPFLSQPLQDSSPPFQCQRAL